MSWSDVWNHPTTVNIFGKFYTKICRKSVSDYVCVMTAVLMAVLLFASYVKFRRYGTDMGA